MSSCALISKPFVYQVEITEVQTGKKRWHEVNRNYEPWTDYEPDRLDYYVEYMWMEGNFSCDCNLEIFFHPDNEIDWDGNRCGDMRCYRVTRILRPDGSDLYHGNLPAPVPFTCQYRNWQHETSVRRFLPIMTRWLRTPWHGETITVVAWDVDKQAVRFFEFAHIIPLDRDEILILAEWRHV